MYWVSSLHYGLGLIERYTGSVLGFIDEVWNFELIPKGLKVLIIIRQWGIWKKANYIVDQIQNNDVLYILKVMFFFCVINNY